MADFTKEGEGRRDYGHTGEKTSEGRVLRSRRPRIATGGSQGGSEKVNYESRRSFGGGERRSFGGNRGGFGQRRNFDRPGYGADRNSESGERSFGGERRNFGGERRGFGGDERRPFGGNRGGFGQNRDDRKPFAKGVRKPFRKNEFSFNERDEESINRLLSGKPQLENMELPEGGVAEPLAKDEVRLNKFIANSGVCSRREADTFIQAGVVTVNGETVTELGTKVNIFNDDVRFNGERLKGEEKVYIVMNKPKGFVTTASDPHAEKTVMDLLKGCKSRVFPVGRLDKATTGVLMFTNDGEIAERLTHPSYDKKKIYQVILDHPVTQEDFDKVLAGVTLTDGDVAADELEYIDENDKRKLGIEIHSGKNRIVRRIFESLGYDVRALDRVYFAGLTKKGLKKGEWRYLSEQEANILKMGAYV